MSQAGKRKRAENVREKPLLRRRVIFCQDSAGNGSDGSATVEACNDIVAINRAERDASSETDQRSSPNEIQQIVCAAAQSVFDALGAGLSESVYRDALLVELETRGVRVRADREVVLPIHYAGRYVGFCRSDIVLLCSNAPQKRNSDALLIVELKAVAGRLSISNVQQLSAYMRLLRAKYGALINFVQGTDPTVRDALKQKQLVLAPATHTAPIEFLCVNDPL